MPTLTVGPSGQQFTTIAAAVNAASAGDTIDVQAATYNNDFLSIQKDLTLQAVNGEVVMTATQSPPDGKAIIDEGGASVDVAINGFDISGAAVADNNGAAVRYEGGTLSLTNDYFHNNQEGLLGGADPNGSITINHSEFAFNGDGSGSTHNLYAGDIASLSITASYFHDAIVGHEIKSRAETTTITDSRIFDNNSSASYSVDAPNGGNLTIQNDVIEQGPNTQNPFIIAYGEEGSQHSGTNVSISGNTIVNDDATGNATGVLDPTSLALPFTNNSVYGLTSAQISAVQLAISGTVFLTSRPSLDTSSLSFACYARGTRILTDRGEVAVEQLREGDRVVLARGATAQVRWIGYRRVIMCSQPRKQDALPVRVRGGAFGNGLPVRDLLLSPDHAVFVGGVLIPIRYLINGCTVVQEPVAEVTYYHVELPAHDVILAEGLPCESYLDTGNRAAFEDGSTTAVAAVSAWSALPHAEDPRYADYAIEAAKLRQTLTSASGGRRGSQLSVPR